MQMAAMQQAVIEQQQAAMAQQQAQAQAQTQAQAQAAHMAAQAQAPAQPLTISALLNVAPEEQKNMIGEQLYPLVQRELENKQQPPDRAGKITGMLLDGVETSDLLELLQSMP